MSTTRVIVNLIYSIIKTNKKTKRVQRKAREKTILLYNKRSKLIDQMRILLLKQSNEKQYNEKNNLINEKKKNVLSNEFSSFKKKTNESYRTKRVSIRYQIKSNIDSIIICHKSKFFAKSISSICTYKI